MKKLLGVLPLGGRGHRGIILTSAFLAGCSTIRTTDPSRTATEQFLMSEAAVKAVAQLSFESLRGRLVYLDDTYFTAVEKAFILGEIRALCLSEGLQLVTGRDEAQIVMEVRSGGVGIDRKDFLLGVPPLLLTADSNRNVSDVPILTPELAFLKNIEQRGYATIAVVAYWAKTGQFVASSGPFIGRTLRDDWWFMGFGPETVGNVPTIEGGDK